MKTMTCKQLAGACNQTFSAVSFNEIAAMSQQHGKEMLQQGDQAHIDAMNEIGNLKKRKHSSTIKEKNLIFIRR